MPILSGKTEVETMKGAGEAVSMLVIDLRHTVYGLHPLYSPRNDV